MSQYAGTGADASSLTIADGAVGGGGGDGVTGCAAAVPEGGVPVPGAPDVGPPGSGISTVTVVVPLDVVAARSLHAGVTPMANTRSTVRERTIGVRRMCLSPRSRQ